MFAQANSEHCRHKIFNAEWYVDGEKQERSLFQWIKRTTEARPAGVLSAYKDNAAVVEGNVAERLLPRRRRRVPRATASRSTSSARSRPTTIRPRSRRSPAPRPARAARSATRARPAAARSRRPASSASRSRTCACPDALEPWEQGEWIGEPGRIASALDIMIDGPLGGAAFNNEFGRPAILGYFRTFELARSARSRGYHKPVMLAGGIGAMRAAARAEGAGARRRAR